MSNRCGALGALAVIAGASACSVGGPTLIGSWDGDAGMQPLGVPEDAGTSPFDMDDGAWRNPFTIAHDAEPISRTAPPCPSDQPIAGAACTEGAGCEYGSSPVPACDTFATCGDAGWTLQAPTSGERCPTTRSAACPASPPPSLEQPCSQLGLICDFPSARCYCLDIVGPRAPDGAIEATWQCQQPTEEGCPMVRPRIGSTCQVAPGWCGYGACFIPGGNGERCVEGAWEDSPIDYPCAE